MFDGLSIKLSKDTDYHSKFSTTLTYPVALLGVYFISDIKECLNKDSDLFFLGTDDVIFLDASYKKFVAKNFPLVSLDFPTIDLISFLWVKTRDTVNAKLICDRKYADIEKEKVRIMQAVITEAEFITTQNLQGKTFTRLQGELILATVDQLAQFGNKESQEKKEETLPSEIKDSIRSLVTKGHLKPIKQIDFRAADKRAELRAKLANRGNI